LFRLWKRAGLHILYVGLEAMDARRLDNYKKKTTVETNRRAIEILREIGITLHASFLVTPIFPWRISAPGTEVMQVIPAEVSFTVFSPSPGTELWHKHKVNISAIPTFLRLHAHGSAHQAGAQEILSPFLPALWIAWRNNP